MTSTESKQPKKSLRKRIVSSLKNKKDDDMEMAEEETLAPTPVQQDDDRRKRRGEGFVGRMRSLSRSRSRSASRGAESGENRHKTIVTVTSCRSDGYYNQKAPGSTSKLPRKAPTNLKLFHELAVGIKDAYAAVGQTPSKPVLETNDITGHPTMSETEFHARTVLWEFVGNIDFVRGLLLAARMLIFLLENLIFSLLNPASGFGGRSGCGYGDSWGAQG
jgi:hypothetical protein